MTELDLLIKEFRERIEMLSDSLLSGGAKSYDEYRAMTGEIRGLSFAKLTVTDLVRKLEHNDD
jgi:predicted  nucleic acid-binding Zn-ribbon protein